MKQLKNFLILIIRDLEKRMNKFFSLFFILLLAVTSSALTSCPTCTGQVERKSLPFFSDKFYQPVPNTLSFDISELDLKIDPSDKPRQQKSGSAYEK